MLVLISLLIFKSEVVKSPFQSSSVIKLETLIIYFRKELQNVLKCYPNVLLITIL